MIPLHGVELLIWVKLKSNNVCLPYALTPPPADDDPRYRARCLSSGMTSVVSATEAPRTVLIQFLTTARRGLGLLLVTSLSINVLLLALPIYSLQIFDRVLLSRSMDTLWLLSLAVLIAMLATTALDALRGQMLSRLSNCLAVDQGPGIFRHLIEQSATRGERSTQWLRDLGTVRSFLSSPQGLVALIDAPMVPLFLGVVYLIHPWLGHTMLIGLIVMLGLAWITDVSHRLLARQAGEAALQAQRQAEAYVQGAEVATAMGMVPQIERHWRRSQNEALALGSAAVDRGALLAAAGRGARLLLNIAQTGIGAYLAIHDQLTLGAMIAANILGARGLGPMEQLIAAGRQLGATREAWMRLAPAIAHAEQAPERTRLPPARGELLVEEASYTPPGAVAPTVRDISFAVPAGTFLGLVGPSSAGKSTLVRLLCGVWPATTGTVRLDGANIQHWHAEDLGQAVGYLPQEVQLLAGTVKQNIARFTDPPDADVILAAQAAGAHDMILALPQGYDTLLTPGAINLSGGQRQRIGLARALFGTPALVILDEPNAHLDAEGEQALMAALAQTQARGATLVVISHRPALLNQADLLAVVVGGRLQHFGPRQEILHRLQQAVAGASHAHA